MLYAYKKKTINRFFLFLLCSQFENLGYSGPLITLPVTFVCLAGSSTLPKVCTFTAAHTFSLLMKLLLFHSAAQLVEYLHVLLRPVVDVPLLFTQSEVTMSATTWCSRSDSDPCSGGGYLLSDDQRSLV